MKLCQLEPWSPGWLLGRPLYRPLLAAGLAGLAACGSNAGTGAEEVPAATHVREGGFVTVPEKSALRSYLVMTTAERQNLQVPLDAPAVLEADPARVANILPPLSGRISALSVHLGDAVKAGQPLFTIDSSELAQARADLQHAQQARTLTGKALARTQDLAAHGIAAQRDLEQAQSDADGAESEYQRAAAVFSSLGVPAEADRSARELTVRSPVAGRVSMLNAVAGTYANDNTAPLMTVSDVSTIWFTASVQEKDLDAVEAGEAVTATVQSSAGETFAAKVSFIADQLEADTRTVKVRASYDNKEGKLKPGMFARVRFQGKAHDAVMLPTTALVQDESKTLVFVEVAPWKFEPRTVLTGARVGESTEILDGIAPGEHVVAKDGVLLND